jgi:hypothetical protein
LVWFLVIRGTTARGQDTTFQAARITRHDVSGVPGKPVIVREPARVRGIVEALGVDALTRDTDTPPVACPADYATAELGIQLAGRDVYSSRSVYVWGLTRASMSAGDDAGAATVVVVSSEGCRQGPIANRTTLERELAAASGKSKP